MEKTSRPAPSGIDTPPTALSPRELQTARALALGSTNREIADLLMISVKTIDTHRGHVLQKLGLRNNADVTRWAVAHGVIPLPENISGLLRASRAFVRDATSMLEENREDEEDIAAGRAYVAEVNAILGAEPVETEAAA